MTYEEINQKYDLGEITPRMNALLSILIDNNCYEDEIIELVENNLYEDSVNIVLNGEEFLIVTDEESKNLGNCFIDCEIDETKYIFNKSSISYLEEYIDWDKYANDRLYDYLDNFEEYEGCEFLGECDNFIIYKKH